MQIQYSRRSNRISPCCFTSPCEPKQPRDNFCTARHRRYKVKTTRKINKIEKIYNGLTHIENINTLVQFGEIIAAIVLIL